MPMKFYRMLFPMLFFSFMISGCSNVKIIIKPEFSITKFNKIAIMDFEGNDKEKGKALAVSFVPMLMEAGFNVIERSQLDHLIKEQKLSMSGVVDNADLLKVFRVAGVKVLMCGNFHLQKKQNTTTSMVAGSRYHPREFYSYTNTETVFDSISVRIIDVSTAEILFSASEKEEIDESDVDDFFQKVADALKDKK